jgi:hypothetical protein
MTLPDWNIDVVPIKMFLTMVLGLLLVLFFWKFSFYLIYGGFAIATILPIKTAFSTDLKSHKYGTWIPKPIKFS